MRLKCNVCRKPVSTEVPDGTVVRAWLECPECVEAQPEYPIETNGTKIAAELRARCNNLTPEERQELLNRGMGMIFDGPDNIS